MDRGKWSNKHLGSLNNTMYMDLKDIIREYALPFLPAKCLFRFRAVCRDWKLQISTPFFAHSQSLCFQSVAGFFYQPSVGPPAFFSVDPMSCGVPDPSLKFLPQDLVIRSSSNGLICCQAQSGDKSYYICNPVTKQYKELPKPSADHGQDPSVVLVFEPSTLNFAADFKLVCAFPSVDFDNATEFDIYSSSEGTWRVSGEICFASKKLVPRSGVYADGVVYWVAKTRGIIAFDLKKERSQLIPHYRVNNSTLGSMHGKQLCSAHIHGGSIRVDVLSNVYTNTMQMHNKARAWEEKACLTLDSSLVVGSGRDQASVLFVSGDLVVAHVGVTIVCYHMKTKEAKVVCSDVAGSGMRFVSYVNSLVYI